MIVFNDYRITVEYTPKTKVFDISVLEPIGKGSWLSESVLIGQDLARQLANDILASLGEEERQP